jgi:disulfide bond formation protein DsbB
MPNFCLTPAREPLALLLWLGAASAILLGSALIAQYAFGMHPCEMCIWQRWPYGILIAIAPIAFLLRNKSCTLKALFGIAILLLMVEVGIAGYHSAVERKLVSGPGGCTGGIAAGTSLDDIRAQILGAPMARCDEPAWLIPGISMANANLAAAAFLLITAIRRRPRCTKEA